MYKKIIYIAFYDTDDSKENRNVSVAAINKVNYIVKSINELGYEVSIVSPSWSSNEKTTYSMGSKVKINSQTELIKFFTVNFRYKFLNIIKYVSSYIQILGYLIKNSKKNELIIVYHSNLLFVPIYLLKKIKGIKICLEIEEIYSDVQNNNFILNFFERKLIEIADSYVLSTSELRKRYQIKNKKNIVIEGSYLSKIKYNKYDFDKSNNFFSNDKIHLVYAGTFDLTKRGAEIAIKAASELGNEYHLHVIGFGNFEEVKFIKNLIAVYNENSECEITYHGLLIGEEYSSFLLNCDIGLSTQEMDGKYNNSSFPSKILSYMSHGLSVVSCKIDSVQNSRIASKIYFYEKNDPKIISQVIKNINKTSSSQEFLKEIHEDIKKDLAGIINE